MTITQNSFAAFIMTFQRNETLESTIKIILEQSVSPQKVVIVDNDPAQGAKIVADKFNHLSVEYYSVGYNSGPAGAAKKGLEILSKDGYEWIGWIDDDDPPIFKNTFEVLLKLGSENKQCGCVGAVGQRFNSKTGLMLRVPDNELEGEGYIQVDNIAGGMCKIVNASVVNKCNILPDEKLFYGFEELDFDLRLQTAGYLLLVDKNLYKKHRIHFNRSGVNLQRGQKKPKNRLWREYYSTRNCLIILHKLKLYRALIHSVLRFNLKMIAGFRFGFSYGVKNFKYVSKGIIHFFLNQKGSLIFKINNK